MPDQADDARNAEGRETASSRSAVRNESMQAFVAQSRCCVGPAPLG